MSVKSNAAESDAAPNPNTAVTEETTNAVPTLDAESELDAAAHNDAIVKTQPARTAPAARAMENLLGSKLKCTLDDGRQVTGDLLAIDRLKNIILAKAVEERQTDPALYSGGTLGENSVTVTRELSQAMIPGKHLVQVQVEQTAYDSHIKPVMTQDDSS